MNEWDIKLLICLGIMIAGGGVAWGLLKGKVTDLGEKFSKCRPEDLLTNERHREICDSRQAPVMLQLNNIEGLLKEMKQERRKFDERLGALSSKLDVFDDRWGRANG